MKKQTISKIAAIGLAAMTVVPMFGIAASADVTLSEGNANNGGYKQAWGTANKAEWQINYVTETVYELEPYKSGEAINYKLKVKSTSTTNYTAMNTTAVTITTPDGTSPSLEPYGCIFYAYSNSLPKKYSDSTNTTPGVKDVLDKAKKDSDDDKTKIDTALTQWNAALTATANAKKNPTKSFQFKLSDGKTVYAWSQDGTSVVYFNEPNNLTSASVDVSRWDFGKELDGTTDVTLSDGSTDSITSSSTFNIYTYNYTASTKSGIGLSDVVSNLGATKIGLDTDGTTLKADTTAGYSVVNGGEVVPGQNADGSNSSGIAGSGNGTLTPDASSSDVYSAAYPWYNKLTKKYYKTKQSAAAASNGNESYVVQGPQTAVVDTPTIISSSTYYSTTYPYYSSLTRRYYKSYPDALSESNGIASYVSYGNASTTTYDSSSYVSSTYPYYSSLTGRYYRTWETAVAASGNNSSYVKYAYTSTVSSSSTYSSTYPWYSSYTGRYYKTYADAVSVSPNSSYVSSGNYYDPYYYYYGLNGLSGLGTTSTSSSSKNTSSTVTVGNSKGWSAVTKAVNNAKSGSEITVNMSKETTIPADVMSALKGKNVTVDFKLSNGATYAINGTSVSSTNSVDVATTYGTKNVPSSIVSKAVKANNGVSSAQFSVSNGSLGANAAVTVKVSDKRAGSSAKLYRYDSSSNSLTLVSKSAVQSTGKVEFTNVKQGGNYVIVLS